MSETAFHLKYRPQSLDRIVGHEQTVTRLKGIVSSGKIPNALMFTGPSSVGKTTLARCFAAAINEVPSIAELSGDYKELNGTSERSIEEMRNVIKLSMYRPQHKKRVIVVDEFQGILSTPASAAALLKPLEEPSKNTVWVLCTMDPTKLGSGNGKAIANRCTQFALNPPSLESLKIQAKRIIKKEGMDYCKSLIEQIAESSNYEMRTLANLIQALNQYYNGLDKKPKHLKAEDLSEVLSTVNSVDDELAIECLLGIYNKKYKQVYKSILDCNDSFKLLNAMLWGNQHLLSCAVLEGARHPKVRWYLNTNKKLEEKTKKLKLTLGELAHVNEVLVKVKSEASSFVLGADDLLNAHLYRLIKDSKS